MATLTPTLLSGAGINESSTMVQAGSCGDKFKVTGNRCFIRLSNAAANSRTVTIPNQQPLGVDITVLLDTLLNAPANDKMIAFPSIDAFVDTDGYVNINYSAETSVTVGVFQLP